MTDRFSKLNPFVHTAYFFAVFVFVLSVYHPAYSAVALVASLAYSVKNIGRKAWSTIKFVLFILVTVSLFNFLFAHYGEDVLFCIRNTNFTLESLFYGFNQGMVLASVMVWFSAFSRVADSERVLYVLRFAPKLALLFSMILGFMPRFSRKLEDIRDAQQGLNGGKVQGNRFKTAVDNFSALISYSLESSIITADSMSARGYNPKVVRAGRYRFSISDGLLLGLIFAISIVLIIQKVRGQIVFVFEPVIYNHSFSVIAFVAFVALMLLPTIIDLWEDMLWKASNLKA